MNDCVFCKILAGDIPSYQLFEDEHCVAILDAFPGTKGHSLVLPKKHYQDISDVPEELYGHMMRVVKRLAGSFKKALNYDGINIMQHNGSPAGQTVFHIHIHLFPRWSGDEALGGWNPGQMMPAEYELLKTELLKHI
ncbi:MAG: HIT family protein [Spirochaetota bacterium]|nr:HIT family protein [Spirochaetota bacterium]